MKRRHRHQSAELPRFCREVQSQLPVLLAGEVTGWGARTMRRHLKRCPDCSRELERQQELTHSLAALRAEPLAPPPHLLDNLLARVHKPSLRERAAVPARGAVSGARPELSVAFLTVGALASTGIGWAAWRGARAVTSKVRNR